MSNFINEYKNLHDHGDFSVLPIIELFAKSDEISEIDNITSDVGKTILAMGEDGKFSIALQLKNRDINEIYNLHTHLTDLSKNIDRYIKNRGFIQRLKDIFIDQRFITLYKLKHSLPKILATLESKEGMNVRFQTAAINAKISKQDRMKQEKLEKLDSTFEELGTLSQSPTLTRDALAVLVETQQKIENLKEKLTYDTTLPVFCEPKTDLTKYIKKLGKLNRDISQLEQWIPTIQNEEVKKTAEEHLKTLKKLRKDLKKNGNVTLPKYGKKTKVSKNGTTKVSKDGTTVYVKNNVIEYINKQASAKATAKNNQKERTNDVREK